MKKIKLFSILFLITIIFIGCTSDESNARKVAQEFGTNLYTVDTEKVEEYRKMVKEGKKIDFSSVDIAKTGEVYSHTQEYIKIMQSIDKNIQPLMTEKGYESVVANRFNTLSVEVCSKGSYTLQVIDFILDKNLYGEKGDKVGYYYEAKLKFISIGKDEQTDIVKGYIGLLKENGQWKVFVHKLETQPELYKEILMNNF